MKQITDYRQKQSGGESSVRETTSSFSLLSGSKRLHFERFVKPRKFALWARHLSCSRIIVWCFGCLADLKAEDHKQTNDTSRRTTPPRMRTPSRLHAHEHQHAYTHTHARTHTHTHTHTQFSIPSLWPVSCSPTAIEKQDTPRNL